MVALRKCALQTPCGEVRSFGRQSEGGQGAERCRSCENTPNVCWLVRGRDQAKSTQDIVGIVEYFHPFIYIYIHIHTYIHISIFRYIYVYIYIYTETYWEFSWIILIHRISLSSKQYNGIRCGVSNIAQLGRRKCPSSSWWFYVFFCVSVSHYSPGHSMQVLMGISWEHIGHNISGWWFGTLI